MDACTIAALDAIAAFAAPNPNCSSQGSWIFRVWWLNELPRRADHPAYFGLANVTQTNPFGRRQQQRSHRRGRKSMPHIWCIPPKWKEAGGGKHYVQTKTKSSEWRLWSYLRRFTCNCHRQVLAGIPFLRFWAHLRAGRAQAAGLVPAAAVASVHGVGRVLARDGEAEHCPASATPEMPSVTPQTDRQRARDHLKVDRWRGRNQQWSYRASSPELGTDHACRPCDLRDRANRWYSIDEREDSSTGLCISGLLMRHPYTQSQQTCNHRATSREPAQDQHLQLRPASCG